MEWGTTDRHTYTDRWTLRIGDAPGLLRANNDVHLLIHPRLFTLLPGKKKKGYWDGSFSTLEN